MHTIHVLPMEIIVDGTQCQENISTSKEYSMVINALCESDTHIMLTIPWSVTIMNSGYSGVKYIKNEWTAAGLWGSSMYMNATQLFYGDIANLSVQCTDGCAS